MYDTTKPYKAQILELIQKTWETPFVSVKDGFVRRKFRGVEYHHADGIGTKGVYHWSARSFRNAVQDAMAMNLNDCAMVRARPYALIDTLKLPSDDHGALIECIQYLVEECIQRHIAVTGGETAVKSTMRGMELDITMLAFSKRRKLNRLKIGDILVGLGSAGLHANGFTHVRNLFGELPKPEFVVPTLDYSDIILSLNEAYDIHGAMHITGGAFTKLKDILPQDADISISRSHHLEPHPIFRETYMRGLSDEEMYKIFNCGVGFMVGVVKKDVAGCLASLKNYKAGVIGEVVAGRGQVRVQSKFSAREVVY